MAHPQHWRSAHRAADLSDSDGVVIVGGPAELYILHDSGRDVDVLIQVEEESVRTSNRLVNLKKRVTVTCSSMRTARCMLRLEQNHFSEAVGPMTRCDLEIDHNEPAFVSLRGPDESILSGSTGNTLKFSVVDRV